jgi:hypothetical protein
MLRQAASAALTCIMRRRCTQARPAIDDDHRALIREQPVLQPRAGFQRPHRHDRIMPRHTAAKAC